MVTTYIGCKNHLRNIMWKLLSFMQGRARKLCLQSLYSGPKIPSAIAASTDLYLTHVSRALKELSERGLVECVTPDATKNRIYRITDEGIEIFIKMNEMNNNK